MGRARRARRIAQTAAFGGGVGVAGLGALGVLSYGVLRVEAALTRRIVGSGSRGRPSTPAATAPAGQADSPRLLGDRPPRDSASTIRTQTIGAIIANGVAAFSGRPVELTNVAVVGAESPDLEAR